MRHSRLVGHRRARVADDEAAWRLWPEQSVCVLLGSICLEPVTHHRVSERLGGIIAVLRADEVDGRYLVLTLLAQEQKECEQQNKCKREHDAQRRDGTGTQAALATVVRSGGTVDVDNNHLFRG